MLILQRLPAIREPRSIHAGIIIFALLPKYPRAITFSGRVQAKWLFFQIIHLSLDSGSTRSWLSEVIL